jgi:hypothetical protein
LAIGAGSRQLASLDLVVLPGWPPCVIAAFDVVIPAGLAGSSSPALAMVDLQAIAYR